MVYFGRRAGAETQRQWRRLSSLSARFLELIQGLPTLRAFNRADPGRREVRRPPRACAGPPCHAAGGLPVGPGHRVPGRPGRRAGGHGARAPAARRHGEPLATALAVLLVSPEVFLPLRRAGAEFHARPRARRRPSGSSTSSTPRFGSGRRRPRPPSRPPRPIPAPAIGLRRAHRLPGRPVAGRRPTSTSGWPPASTWPWSGRRARGSRPVLALLLGFVPPDAGSVTVVGSTWPRAGLVRLAPPADLGAPATPTCSRGRWPTTCGWPTPSASDDRPAGGPRDGRSGRPGGPAAGRPGHAGRRGRPQSERRRAGHGWPWPGRSSATPRWCSWTSRRPTSTRPPRPNCGPPSSRGSRGAACWWRPTAPSWSSRIDRVVSLPGPDRPEADRTADGRPLDEPGPSPVEVAQ